MGGHRGYRRPPRHACPRGQHWGHGFRSRFGRRSPFRRPSARRLCTSDAARKRVSHAHHQRREPTRPLPSTASRTRALRRCPDLLEPIPDAGRHLCGTRHTPQLDQQPICAPSRGARRRCDVRGAIDTRSSSRALSGGSTTSTQALMQVQVDATCDERATVTSSQSGSSRFPGMGGGRYVQGSR